MKELSELAEIQVKYTSPISADDSVQVKSSADIYNAVHPLWDKDMIAYQEAFLLLLLNRANIIIGYRWISFGGMSATVVDAKHIFGIALKCAASSIAICHNHPSSNEKPSVADIDLTRQFQKGADLLNIAFLDHLIITPDSTYYSFADEGLL